MHVTIHEWDEAPAAAPEFVAVISRMNGRWLVCRHAARETWEFPGGRIEPGETPDEAAARELYEETGALRYDLTPLALYAVRRGEAPESFGVLYAAEVTERGAMPPFEMAEAMPVDAVPERLTYPAIYPVLLDRAFRFFAERSAN